MIELCVNLMASSLTYFVFFSSVLTILSVTQPMQPCYPHYQKNTNLFEHLLPLFMWQSTASIFLKQYTIFYPSASIAL